MNTPGTDTPPSWTAPAAPPPVGRPGPATVAAVVGTAGLITSIGVVGGLIGAVGLVLGVVALGRSGRTGVGRGQAITAVATSLLAIVVSVLVAVFLVWYAHKTQSCYHFNHFHQYQQCVSRQLSDT